MSRLTILAAACCALATPLAAQTIAEVRTRAEAGDTGSQYLLGEAYRTGQGVTPDREQAIVWFRRAYLRGDARAADALGLLLFTKGERRESVPLLQSAAARGDARALYILGTAHFNGDGVPQSTAMAYAEMRKAAATGLPQAVRSLAIMEPFVTDADRAASASVQIGAPQTSIVGAPSPVLSPPVPAPVTPPASPVTIPAYAPAARLTPALPPPGYPPATTKPLAPPSIAPDPAPSLPRSTGEPFSTIRTVDLPPSAPPAPAAAIPPETTAQPAGRWRVQLGALVSQEKAEEQWRMLVRRVPTLGRLAHTTPQAGTFWRLQATGLPDRVAAQETCSAVTDKGQPCIVLAP